MLALNNATLDGIVVLSRLAAACDWNAIITRATLEVHLGCIVPAERRVQQGQRSMRLRTAVDGHQLLRSQPGTILPGLHRQRRQNDDLGWAPCARRRRHLAHVRGRNDTPLYSVRLDHEQRDCPRYFQTCRRYVVLALRCCCARVLYDYFRCGCYFCCWCCWLWASGVESVWRLGRRVHLGYLVIPMHA